MLACCHRLQRCHRAESQGGTRKRARESDLAHRLRTDIVMKAIRTGAEGRQQFLTLLLSHGLGMSDTQQSQIVMQKVATLPRNGLHQPDRVAGAARSPRRSSCVRNSLGSMRASVAVGALTLQLVDH